MQKKFYWIDLTLRTFDNEDDKNKGGGNDDANKGGGNDDDKNKGVDKKFTQSDVDGIVAKRVNELRDDLKKFADQQQLTEKQKKDLEARLATVSKEKEGTIETLRTQVNTLEKKLDDESKRLIEEARAWENRFKETLVANEITAAAVKHQAIDVHDIIALVRPQIRITPEVDGDNKPNGKFKIAVNSTGEGGKDVLLAPDDFMAQFKSRKPQFFRGAKGGAGTENNNSSTGKGLSTMTKEEKVQNFKEAQKAKSRLGK